MPDDADFTYRGGLVLTSVLGALMIWGVVREFGPLKWIFSTAVMRWLGQRSFSLYLWHWPVVMILRAIFDGNHSSDKPWILGLVAIPISFLLAELSYQFVENPFRRGGYKDVDWLLGGPPSISEMKDGFAKAFWPFVPLIVVASLVGVGYALATSSDKSELEQQLEMLQQKNTQSNQGNPGAAAAPASPEENTSRPMPTGNEITAIGDSVMLAASEALQQRYPGIYVDADVSRHYTAAIPIIQQLKDSGQLRSTVFLGFGTNGPAFPDQIQEVVDLIGPDHTIVMAVPYGDRGWMAQSQRDVIDAAKSTTTSTLLTGAPTHRATRTCSIPTAFTRFRKALRNTPWLSTTPCCSIPTTTRTWIPSARSEVLEPKLLERKRRTVSYSGPSAFSLSCFGFR